MYSGICHFWNIVESGIKHYQTNKTFLLKRKNWSVHIGHIIICFSVHSTSRYVLFSSPDSKGPMSFYHHLVPMVMVFCKPLKYLLLWQQWSNWTKLDLNFPYSIPMIQTNDCCYYKWNIRGSASFIYWLDRLNPTASTFWGLSTKVYHPISSHWTFQTL